MARNLSHDLKRFVAWLCALTVVGGSAPAQPIADLVQMPISASAEGDSGEAESEELTPASVTTAPAAVEGLSYTGSAYPLVTEGTAENGTIKYAKGRIISGNDLEITDPEIGTIYKPENPNGDGHIYFPGKKYIKYTAGTKTDTIESDYNNKGACIVKLVGKENFVLWRKNIIGEMRFSPQWDPETYDAIRITSITDDTVICEVVKAKTALKWSDSIPEETNAGTYGVSWYVKGNAGYADTSPQTLSVTIAKATPTEGSVNDQIYFTAADSVYSGEAYAKKNLSIKASSSFGKSVLSDPNTVIKYEYFKGETKLADAPADAGEYTIRATFSNPNYETVTKSDTFTIKKMPVTVTIKSSAVSYSKYTAAELIGADRFDVSEAAGDEEINKTDLVKLTDSADQAVTETYPNVGTYKYVINDAVAGTGVNANYSFTISDPSLNVTKLALADAVYSAEKDSYTYD